MILRSEKRTDLEAALDRIGLGAELQRERAALIKVNLARPPQPGHPRSDAFLIDGVVQYIVSRGASCAIAEGADGFLEENIKHIGLNGLITEHNVRLIDVDLQQADAVEVDDEIHYLPRCLREYGVRIGIPATSKRPQMTFSNNVKLFVGAVPRRMYQIGEPVSPRPRVHIDLHRSVANIYRAVMAYAPFGFFVNGGAAMIEGEGEIDLPEILVGNDAVELDQFVLNRLGIEPPEYIGRLAAIG